MHPQSLPMKAPFHFGHDFVVGDCNRVAYRMIMDWPNWPDPILYLHGPAQAGKSHLGFLWQQKIQHQYQKHIPVYDAWSSHDYDLWCMSGYPPLLWDVSSGQLPCDERLLYHTINEVRHHGSFLLWIGALTLGSCPVSLNDLASRLQGMVSVTVQKPDDDVLHQLMQQLFLQRGLKISDDVMKYLLHRVPRSYQGLLHVIQKLDDYAWDWQKNLTIPVIKDVFSDDDRV